MSRLLAVIATVLLSFHTQAQGLWNHLEIRKSFESLDDRDEPAALSLTIPRDGVRSYLVNAGVAYEFELDKHADSVSSKITLSPFFVLNKNTMIEEEQNNHKAGLSLNTVISKVAPKAGSSSLEWTNTFEYVGDEGEDKRSLVVTSYFSPSHSRLLNNNPKPGTWYIRTYKQIRNCFEYFIGFSAGAEYQHNFIASDEASRGGILRGFYLTEFRLMKTSRDEFPLLELVVSNVGRYAVVNTTGVPERYIPLIKAELLLFPAKTTDFSLSLSYNTGADPIAGLVDQDFFQVALKFKSPG